MGAAAAKPTRPVAKRHDYITDGRRLVMVLRISRATGSWLVEDVLAPVNAPDLDELSAEEIASGRWRRVYLEKKTDG